jgi:hypothetical protein
LRLAGEDWLTPAKRDGTDFALGVSVEENLIEHREDGCGRKSVTGTDPVRKAGRLAGIKSVLTRNNKIK